MTEPDGPGDGVAARIPRRPVPEKPHRLRRFLKFCAISFVIVVVLLAGAGIVLYNMVDVPSPESITTSQAATITYADGKTTLAKLGSQNRTDVPISKVPERVRYAVLAAEDRKFYSEGGVSITGTVRAAWNDVRGGSLQGGSTITQQYVKNAFLTQQRTLSRKVKEAIIASKLSRKYSKNQILEWYLNTIYFGRGAYGIEAAAQTYFGKSIGSISTAEAAVLASSIRAPALYDPQNHAAQAKARWHFVIEGLVTMGKLEPSMAATLKYPAVRPINSSNLSQLGGPDGHIVDQVKEELAQHGFDEAALGKGIKVITTIDPKAQDAAENAIKDTFTGQPKNLRNALVAIDPKSGQVRAYYGGSNGFGFDYAQAWRQPGSTFKPYVLATGLSQTEAGKQDITDYSDYNGTSPQVLGGVTVHNSDGESCGYCSVVTAMTMSLNTVFYQMGLQVGPDQVAKTAHAAGIPADNGDAPTLQGSDGRTDAGISIGQYEVRPIDQAAGYATIAAGGVRRQPYFVKEITDSSGRVLYRHQDSTRRAFSSAVANDVTYSMEQVAGSSGDPLAGGRPSAAKTGTAQLGETADNKDAWMVGFTPQISAAVWTGSDGSAPIKNADGAIVYGSGLPGQAWARFMNSYLDGTDVQPLPTQTQVGSAPVTDPTSQQPTASATTPEDTTPTRSSSPPSSSAPPSSSQAPTSASSSSPSGAPSSPGSPPSSEEPSAPVVPTHEPSPNPPPSHKPTPKPPAPPSGRVTSPSHPG